MREDVITKQTVLLKPFLLAGADPASPPKSQPAPTVRVLLVDGDPTDARLLQAGLTVSERGFEMTCVARLSEALEAQGGTADVILLELSLPDSEGLESLLSVRRAYPAVPVVVLTGKEDEDLALLAVRHGAQDFIVKGSTDWRSLARALRFAVERQRHLRETSTPSSRVSPER